MKKSPNQLRVELKEIATGHLQINSFYWGDLIDATEDVVTYPLMNCYYPSGTPSNNTTNIQLVIEVADKLYKDSLNLNDVESDTLQVIRDIYNILNKSLRWKKIGKIQNATFSKFKWSTGDEIAGHRLTVNFILRDFSGVCDLPMYNYDFDGETPSGGCADARVINTDLSFDQVVSSGGILELPDIIYDIKNTEGTTIITGSEVAQSNLDEVLPDVTHTDSNGSSVIYPSGKDFTCTPSSATSSPRLYKSGQTASYATGDDGDIESGDGNSFTTLSHNNIFGNTNRFTDELGTQIYANGIVINHYTKWLDGSKVLGYALSPSPTNITWLDANTYCANFNAGGFTGWRQGNIIEITDLIYYTGGGLTYAPFNISQYIWLWTGTSKSSTISYRVQNTGSGSVANTGAYCRAMPVRYFTWDGTQLT